MRKEMNTKSEEYDQVRTLAALESIARRMDSISKIPDAVAEYLIQEMGEEFFFEICEARKLREDLEKRKKHIFN